MVMVKPGMPYLDNKIKVIKDNLRNTSNCIPSIW